MDEPLYSISEVSEMFSISYRTLHYYEQKFELPVNRDSAGNRLYTEDNVKVLDMIIELKKKGMTLVGIKTILQEKGIIDPSKTNDVTIYEDKPVVINTPLIDELNRIISSQIREEFKAANNKMDEILKENKDLRQQIEEMKHQSAEHYRKVDEQLTAWRESSQRPWYKKIFGPK